MEKESHFSWKRKTLTRRMHVPELQVPSFLGSVMVAIHKDVMAKGKPNLRSIVAAPDAHKEFGSKQQVDHRVVQGLATLQILRRCN